MASFKIGRVQEDMLRELTAIMREEIKDPRISPFTSVVAVEVAPDLKSCKAWISVLGGEDACKKTLEGLNSAMGYIRRELAHTINLRNTPEIRFVMDQSIAYGVNMSHKIDEVMEQDRQTAIARGDELDEESEADEDFEEEEDEE